jgi:hypothetical protein
MTIRLVIALVALALAVLAGLAARSTLFAALAARSDDDDSCKSRK